MQHLYKCGNDKIFFEAAPRKQEFEQLEECIDEVQEFNQESADHYQELKTFVDNIKGPRKSLEAITQLIEDADHALFTKEICDNLINNLDSKKNVEWIYGAANSGKTVFLKFLKEIFNCTEYKASRSHFEMKYKHGKTQPCFVLMDECTFEKWFKSHDNYSNAKLAFEGQGIVLEQKQKHPKLRW